MDCLWLPTTCSKRPRVPIGSWDVSAVTETSRLLVDAKCNRIPSCLLECYSGAERMDSTHGSLSKWNVPSVSGMESMFISASSRWSLDLCVYRKWDRHEIHAVLPHPLNGHSATRVPPRQRIMKECSRSHLGDFTAARLTLSDPNPDSDSTILYINFTFNQLTLTPLQGYITRVVEL